MQYETRTATHQSHPLPCHTKLMRQIWWERNLCTSWGGSDGFHEWDKEEEAKATDEERCRLRSTMLSIVVGQNSIEVNDCVYIRTVLLSLSLSHTLYSFDHWWDLCNSKLVLVGDVFRAANLGDGALKYLALLEPLARLVIDAVAAPKIDVVRIDAIVRPCREA